MWHRARGCPVLSVYVGASKRSPHMHGVEVWHVVDYSVISSISTCDYSVIIFITPKNLKDAIMSFKKKSYHETLIFPMLFSMQILAITIHCNSKFWTPTPQFLQFWGPFLRYCPYSLPSKYEVLELWHATNFWPQICVLSRFKMKTDYKIWSPGPDFTNKVLSFRPDLSSS